MNASDLKWGPAPNVFPAGAQLAVISGDPFKEGLYVVRMKMPAGYKIPASWETHIHSYTVLAGQVTIVDNGEKHLLGPGGYAVLTSRDKYELGCGPVPGHDHRPDRDGHPARPNPRGRRAGGTTLAPG